MCNFYSPYNVYNLGIWGLYAYENMPGPSLETPTKLVDPVFFAKGELIFV